MKLSINFKLIIVLTITLISCEKAQQIDYKLIENKNWYFCRTNEECEEMKYDYLEGGILKLSYDSFDSSKSVSFINANTNIFLDSLSALQEYYDDNENVGHITSLTEDTLIIAMRTPLNLHLYNGSYLPFKIDTLRFTSSYKNIDFFSLENYSPQFKVMSFYFELDDIKVDITPKGKFYLSKKGVNYKGQLNENELSLLKKKLLVACYISKVDRVFFKTNLRIGLGECWNSNIKMNIQLEENHALQGKYDYMLRRLRLRKNELSIYINEGFCYDYNLAELTNYIKHLSETVEGQKVQVNHDFIIDKKEF
ncbi:hypothetical protein KMW28_24405 [Flammeovirga yaeyamensis]|uniref:Lipoprotein n=1 Tax=Flammeovirga yaeyamensis TaxID=367791 RepID=A0AAX1NA16_9BACT|nr:hypothetical protein [Flammeovirga yaeyamensis]MBB3699572.1 hypothetical protein [Flammeovirga yaeyamensis]NMF35173.1 hypothetical protein [Flammeovirga yaeyamensis]QWG04037.1 hypothetical protein KMW28_24405 [Flammeovirga yaeyamensis]